MGKVGTSQNKDVPLSSCQGNHLGHTKCEEGTFYSRRFTKSGRLHGASGDRLVLGRHRLHPLRKRHREDG